MNKQGIKTNPGFLVAAAMIADVFIFCALGDGMKGLHHG
jgi:hypothetical protein